MAWLRWSRFSPSFPRSGGDAGEAVEVRCSWSAHRGGDDDRLLELLSLVPSFVDAGWALAPSLRVWGWCGVIPACVVGGCCRLYRSSVPADLQGRVAAEVVLRHVVVGSGCSGSDRKWFELGVCRRPMFLQCVADPLLRNWWLLRLVKAFWRGVPPLPGFVIDVFFAGVRAGGVAGPWREVEDGVGPQGSLFLYPFIVFLYFLAFGCCFLATM
jgi:hypothetical protein